MKIPGPGVKCGFCLWSFNLKKPHRRNQGLPQNGLSDALPPRADVKCGFILCLNNTVGRTKMNRDRIKTALKEIEASVPPGKAQVRFDVYGGGVDESFIRGSRAGLVRLGVRLIRAAIEEEKQKSMNGAALVGESLDDVVHPSSDVKFDWIEVAEDLEADAAVRAKSQRSLRRTTIAGVAIVLFAVVIFLVWRLR